VAAASSPILDGEPVERTMVEAFAKKRQKLWEVLSYVTASIMFVASIAAAYLWSQGSVAWHNYLQYVASLVIVGFIIALRGYRQYDAMHDAVQSSAARCRLIGQRLFIIHDGTPAALPSYRLVKRDIAKLMTPTVPSARAKVI